MHTHRANHEQFKVTVYKTITNNYIVQVNGKILIVENSERRYRSCLKTNEG